MKSQNYQSQLGAYLHVVNFEGIKKANTFGPLLFSGFDLPPSTSFEKEVKPREIKKKYGNKK